MILDDRLPFIQWHDFLLMLDGQLCHFPARKSQNAKEIVFNCFVLLARITCPVNHCPSYVDHRCLISKETIATKNFTSAVSLVYNIDVNKV